MAKYNIENLTPFKSKWHNKPTTVIRVPEILVDQILEYAHQLDLENRPKKNN